MPSVSTPLRVVVVEDNGADAELMIRELRRSGFDPSWEQVQTEPEFLARLVPDLEVILADFTLPRFGATRALELVNERHLDVPLIVVSGTIGEESAVHAMQQGAS